MAAVAIGGESPRRECVVCYNVEGEVYKDDFLGRVGEEVVMYQARCIHDVCMGCFEKLKEVRTWNCTVCRRPSVLAPAFIRGDRFGSNWLSRVVHRDGRGVEYKFNPVSVYQDFIRITESMEDLDAVEIAGIIENELKSRGADIESLITEEGPGELDEIASEWEQRGFEVRRRSEVFKGKLAKIIRQVAAASCKAISRRRVQISPEENRDLVSRDDLPEIFEEIKEGLDCIMEDLEATNNIVLFGRVRENYEAMIAFFARLGAVPSSRPGLPSWFVDSGISD